MSKIADQFFQIWVDLHGRHGIGNYIHMIDSGHMYQYMVRWDNLTKYSHQGWEALNSLIKLFFFQRSNKGGCRSGPNGTKSKLLPIGQIMQIRFFWICNLVPSSLWDKNFELEDVDKCFSFDKDIISNSDLLADA